MGLVGEPGLSGALRAAIDPSQDSFGARNLAAHGTDRYTTLTYAEEGTNVAIMREVKNDALTELMVGNPFTRLKLRLYFHASISGNSQMEKTRSFRALAQQNFLRILVRFAPEQTTKVEAIATVRRFAQPRHCIGSSLHTEAFISLRHPEDQRAIAPPFVLKRENCAFYRISQPHFTLIRRQQIKTTLKARNHQRFAFVAG